MNLQPLILLALPALAAIWSIATIIRGRRSRVAGDHPLCRACGYDLFGRPPDSFRCSECGADLRRRSAIATPGQLRRPELLRRGRRFLLASMLLVAAACWYEARGVNWLHYKPVFWLLHDTKVEKNRDVAFAELLRRLQAGELSQPQLDSIIDRALAAQADLSQPWDGRWGDFVERARAMNRISSERWTAYVKQAWQWSLQVRPKVRRGDLLRIWFAPRHRMASHSVLDLDGQTVFELADHSGHAASRPGNPLFGVNNWQTWCDWSTRELDESAVGPMVARIVLTGTVIDSTAGVAGRSPYAARIEAPWTLLDGSTPSVALITDPQRQAAQHAAMSHPLVEIRPGPMDNVRVSFSIEVGRPPVDFYYEVLVRSPNGAVSLGLINRTGGAPLNASASTWSNLAKSDDRIFAEKVDVILRPDPTKAAQTLDCTEIWGEEIVLKDVPVRRIP